VQPVENWAAVNTSLAAVTIGSWGDNPPVLNPGCAARNGSSNLLYSVRVNDTIGYEGTSTGFLFEVWTSTNAVNWTSVLDAGTQQLRLSRPVDDDTHCGVDLAGNVYDIGSNATYYSSNQGVTWGEVVLTGPRFPSRIDFAGGIFTSALTSRDTLIVIAGQSFPPNDFDNLDLNDVRSH
jgi:hypothetical protein